LAIVARHSFGPRTVSFRKEGKMIFAGDWRRQARVCARLAEDCDDQHLAERLRLMAANLVAKADEIEELPRAAQTLQAAIGGVTTPVNSAKIVANWPRFENSSFRSGCEL
jgi:hypothetical protein